MRLLATLFGTNLADDDRARFDEAATEVHASAPFLEALQMSHNDLAKVLRDTLRAQHPGRDTYVWTRDVFDDSVIYELNTNDQTELYQRSYTITDGAVTLGEPVKVIAVTQYVAADTAGITTPAAVPVTQVSQPAEESGDVLTGDLVPLVEKAVKDDGTAEIRIIAPGQGSSGYYPADVLQRDGPKVFGEGLHIYLDHPSVSDERDRPERSVKDLAGSLTGPAVWREDGLYAPVKFLPTVAPHIGAIAPISGMSIRASGKAGTRDIGGKKVRTIESIDIAHSVDVVTRAGAGGKVMDLIESARNGKPIDTQGVEDEMTKEELEEAQRQLSEAQKQITALEAWKEAQERRDREAALLTEARTVVKAELAAITLPTQSRDRLTETLVLNAPVKDDALDVEALKAKVTEAAAAEVAYIAAITGGNPVRGMGGTEPATPNVPTLEESNKRIEAALAAL
jgi:hypothetical protein